MILPLEQHYVCSKITFSLGMPILHDYFQKRAIRPPLIHHAVEPNTTGIITIPACAEKQLIRTLESLANCSKPIGKFEVLILINHSSLAVEKVKKINQETKVEVEKWIEAHAFKHLNFNLLTEFNLTHKKAGVGTARKILMDEAARRLCQIDQLSAPIIGLDADCLVAQNYLVEIEQYFSKNKDVQACSIHFEHQKDDEKTMKAITQYENHLRYYIEAQRFSGFPFAYQTIGSSMGVRCMNYLKQGGMNRRKAGEDFYFLQKFIELGQFGELNSTTVFPSGRVSDRVPFGTGKAVADALLNDGEVLTYHFQSFLDIKDLFGNIPILFNAQKHDIELMQSGLPESVNKFLQTVDFQVEVIRVQKNTSSENAFRKRFFRWFNAFLLMKYLHFARDHFYPNQPVQEMVSMLRKWK